MNCAHSHILVVTTGDCWSVFSDFSSCLLVFSFFVVSFCAVYVFWLLPVWLSLTVQSVAQKESSLKWSVMCLLDFRYCWLAHCKMLFLLIVLFRGASCRYIVIWLYMYSGSKSVGTLTVKLWFCHISRILYLGSWGSGRNVELPLYVLLGSRLYYYYFCYSQ